VELEEGTLRFPPAPKEPGIYLLVIRQGNANTIYIGETSELRRRFANYRSPGPTQQTNLRLNQILKECLISGGKVAIDIAYEELELSIGGVVTRADLTDKATRRLAEYAALVAHGGVDVETLNR
jgi:hypothetical protein